MVQSSKIFNKNRALGYVSNQVPLVVRYIKSRKDNLIVTCVGRAFHTYSSTHLTLLSVSAVHPDDITCIAADSYHVYTASDKVVRAWRRGTELKHSYLGHSRPVHLLLPFGPHLLSVDDESTLKIWDIKTEELYLELTFDNSSFKITAMLHPNTYLNKIILGSSQGKMQMWNIHTSKLIYTFLGWGSTVTVLQQAPAIDVIAVGLENGKIIIHNIKYDKTIMEFIQDWGIVTSLSFRTDGHPILASGSITGNIVFWDLEERKVASQLVRAHSSSVTGMQCFPNEPLVITSSPDNTLKMWIFDLPDNGARLLKFREGHGAPPSCVQFYGQNGYNLLTSGEDSSLRIFSTVTETFNKSLGFASFNRKASLKKKSRMEDTLRMPHIVNFSSEFTREKEWDNIAAVHSGLPMVTLWSYDKLKMGELKLMADRFDRRKSEKRIQANATCLCVSSCGNFVIIGYNSGHVDRFNMQSGIHRDTYGNPTAHKGSVRGVTTDGLNQVTVTGGSDKLIKFWPFKSSGLNAIAVIKLGDCVAFFTTHRDSSLTAIALEDFSVVVIDLDTREIIRKFENHSSQLTGAAFSPDSRWLVTAAMDCTIRTWDIPSGQLIDCFEVDSACSSLSFSPTGDLLATTHINCLGIFLWSNKTLYSQVSLRPLSKMVEYPLVHLMSTGDSESSEDEWSTREESTEVIFKSPNQICEDLVTLSQIAVSRWQNLLTMDIVKKRNKPREPPKAPRAAPFFLQTLPSLQLKFDLRDAVNNESGIQPVQSMAISNLTVFGKLLSGSTTSEDFKFAFEKLKVYGPSAVDLEVQSLSPEGGGSIELMLCFMKLIESALLSNNDFELAQAYLSIFLKKHGETIVMNKPLLDYLTIVQRCQLSGWKALQDKMLFSLCIVQSLKET